MMWEALGQVHTPSPAKHQQPEPCLGGEGKEGGNVINSAPGEEEQEKQCLSIGKMKKQPHTHTHKNNLQTQQS